MMKKFLLFTLIWISFQGFSQSFPETPVKVDFANVQIVLNTEARQKINTEIQRLLAPKNSFFDQKVERIQLYFPIIEKVLETENVPDDFKYLAVLESALNADAVSPTNAVGFWQFKDFTAEEMGLLMNKNQDDRKNVYLSTQAAAQYLKRNNLIFKNWVSTALSYTVGAGGAAPLVPVDWSFANEIKFDGNPHPYLVKAIAHKIAFENHLKKANPSSKVFIEYPAKGKTLSDISKEVNLPESEIRKYNTWLKSNNVPTDRDYIVLIQTDKTNAELITAKAKDLINTDFISIGYPKLKRLTLVVTSTDQPVFYEINSRKGILAQPGEDIAQLARKGKLSISRFLSFNDMTDRAQAVEGSVYYLQKKYKKADVPYHTLSENQTLWDVSQMYGIRLKNIKKYNRISPEEPIVAGRVLWLQKKRPKNQAIQYNKAHVAPPEVFQPEQKTDELMVTEYEPSKEINSSSTNEVRTHRVLENETLYSIANKYNTTVTELRKLNNLGPKENIQYNQRLKVPYTDEPEDNWEEESTPVLMPSTTKPVDTTPKTEPKKPTFEPVVTTTTTPSRDAIVRETHVIRPGETLFSIANRYGTTVDNLRKLNSIMPNETIKSGQTIFVSGNAADYSNSNAVSTAASGSHTVSRGETLFSISNKYGMTVDDLKRLNNLYDNNIVIGQRLRVSGSVSSSNQAASYHTVKSGETLFSISQRYGVTVEELRSWNNIKNNNLQSGKRIIVRK